MQAEQFVKEGNLNEALESLQDSIRADPANADYRAFLYQLLCIMGQWDRALTQINVVGDMTPGELLMVEFYRNAIRCEALRQEVFAGKTTPLMLGEPEEWLGWMVQATGLAAQGNTAAAAELRDQAFEQAPAIEGTINGEAFEWLADTDHRLGPIMEVIIQGKYYWVPFNHISAIKIDPPGSLRDVVWAQAQFIWSNKGKAVGLIPVRYPGTSQSGSDPEKLARATSYQDLEDGYCIGSGQRVFASSQSETPILETRLLTFGPQDDEDEAQAESAESAGADSNG